MLKPPNLGGVGEGKERELGILVVVVLQMRESEAARGVASA